MGEPAVDVSQAGRPECWCCGGSFDEGELTRLGAHPEVGLCGTCAQWVHRRARALRDGERHGPGPSARRAVGTVREHVIRSGLHEWPVVGSALRWVDRHLP